jgi:hypothetical protein
MTLTKSSIALGLVETAPRSCSISAGGGSIFAKSQVNPYTASDCSSRACCHAAIASSWARRPANASSSAAAAAAASRNASVIPKAVIGSLC